MDPIPAATLILLRDDPAGAPAVLMVERARGLAFAGGAMVFPGGRVDPGDVALAASCGGDADTAARIAAVRETIEEVGIAAGLNPPLADGAVARLREALQHGMPITAALAAAEATFDPAALIPWARWRPAHQPVRVFDTRFYLAPLPADAFAGMVDATENTRLVWAPAREHLAAADRGETSVIFPTRRNLERIARFTSFAAAAAHARAVPQRTIVPWEEVRDGVTQVCIPDDLGYPITMEPLATAQRG